MKPYTPTLIYVTLNVTEIIDTTNIRKSITRYRKYFAILRILIINYKNEVIILFIKFILFIVYIKVYKIR